MRSTFYLLLLVLRPVRQRSLDRSPSSLKKSGDSGWRPRGLSSQAAARISPNDAELLADYAEFLDRYGDPAAAQRIAKCSRILEGYGKTSGGPRRPGCSCSISSGRRPACGRNRHAAYQAAGGNGSACLSRLQVAMSPTATVRPSSSPDRCDPSRAWRRSRRDLSRTKCCPRWPATWSPTVIRHRTATKRWSRPNI